MTMARMFLGIYTDIKPGITPRAEYDYEAGTILIETTAFVAARAVYDTKGEWFGTACYLAHVPGVIYRGTMDDLLGQMATAEAR